MPEGETECEEAAAYTRHIVTCNSITTVDKSRHPAEADRTLQEL